MDLKKINIVLAISLFQLMRLFAQEYQIPFKVDSLFDMSKPETLGLKFVENAETFTVFSPQKDDNKYNHGAVLFPFKGYLYAQWQSSSVDEDGEDTQVFYSRSKDGKVWEKPMKLTEIYENGIKTNGGWYSDGHTLIAYICVWPNFSNEIKQGYTEYVSSNDGLTWSKPLPVTDSDGKPIPGIIEQDVRALPNGRLVTAFHMQPGLNVKPFYSDDTLGISNWKVGKMQNMTAKDSLMSRELEPSWFYRKDGAIVMVFRDQNSSFKKLAAVSYDNGETWTQPQLIDTPDSRAKQSAGNLPDGTAFMVNNPSGNKNRFPLAITLSKDGFVFDKAYLIRSGDENLQPMRYDGKYKRIGYSYPKSIIWGDYLYVSYATNKEDIEITRIPLSYLVYKN